MWRKEKFALSAQRERAVGYRCSWLLGFPACRGMILRLLSFHNFASQSLKMNVFLFIYRSYQFCFSGEIWLINQQGLALVWHPLPVARKLG